MPNNIAGGEENSFRIGKEKQTQRPTITNDVPLLVHSVRVKLNGGSHAAASVNIEIQNNS